MKYPFSHSSRATRLATTLTFAGLQTLINASGVRAQGIADWSADCVYDAGEYGQVATIQGFECLVGNLLASATTLIGLASFVMLIIGAFLYMTSGSSTKGTESAKQTFTYAIIGIIVSLMAFFILFLIAQFTGVNSFLQFDLKL